MSLECGGELVRPGDLVRPIETRPTEIIIIRDNQIIQHNRKGGGNSRGSRARLFSALETDLEGIESDYSLHLEVWGWWVAFGGHRAGLCAAPI